MQRVIRKNHADLLLTLSVLVLFVLSITHMQAVSKSVFSALKLCAHTIIPTLFPFLILTDLLLSTEGTEKILNFISRPVARLFRVSSVGGTVFLLGAFFGFPMGAKAVAHYYSEGRLSKEEGERLLLFSGNASPFFLIGAVGGGMFSSPKAGFTLYIIQLTVSLLCGILLSLYAAPKAVYPTKSTLRKAHPSLSKTVPSAVRQSLFISGYVVFFSAILAAIRPYIRHAFLSHLLASFLEIGNACALASSGGRYALPFCAFSACFSGLSVYFQTLDCIQDTDLKTAQYLPIKVLCGAMGFHIALFFR